MLKTVLILIILYILLINIEGYDNTSNLFIFVELNDNIKKDNIKSKSIKLTTDRAKYLYNYMFNLNKIVNNNNSVGEYLNRVKFVKDNNLANLIIKKINNYYNLKIDYNDSMYNYINVIKLKKFNELWFYFNKNLVNKVILNIILNETNNDKFDENLINKLLELNLIKYEINKINKLLEDTNQKLIKYLKNKFNKEYSNVIVLELNKIRNLVYIGEINI